MIRGRHFLVRTASLAALAAGLAAPAFAEDPISTVTFTCKDGKSIEAAFYSEKVDLKLSDGRTMTLPQTMSGSGIRYANADESLVFWSKGNTAFITEGKDATPTFTDCVTGG